MCPACLAAIIVSGATSVGGLWALKCLIRKEHALWGMWQWLDRAPKGRNEMGHWWRRHDEYDEE